MFNPMYTKYVLRQVSQRVVGLNPVLSAITQASAFDGARPCGYATFCPARSLRTGLPQSPGIILLFCFPFQLGLFIGVAEVGRQTKH